MIDATRLKVTIVIPPPPKKWRSPCHDMRQPQSAPGAGATHIERVDIVVQTLAAHIGMHNATVDQTTRLVDGWLAKNRAA